MAAGGRAFNQWGPTRSVELTHYPPGKCGIVLFVLFLFLFFSFYYFESLAFFLNAFNDVDSQGG